MAVENVDRCPVCYAPVYKGDPLSWVVGSHTIGYAPVYKGDPLSWVVGSHTIGYAPVYKGDHPEFKYREHSPRKRAILLDNRLRYLTNDGEWKVVDGVANVIFEPIKPTEPN